MSNENNFAVVYGQISEYAKKFLSNNRHRSWVIKELHFEQNDFIHDLYEKYVSASRNDSVHYGYLETTANNLLHDYTRKLGKRESITRYGETYAWISKIGSRSNKQLFDCDEPDSDATTETIAVEEDEIPNASVVKETTNSKGKNDFKRYKLISMGTLLKQPSFNPYEQLEVEEYLRIVESIYRSMKPGVRKDVLECLLRGVGGNNSSQDGKEIAFELGYEVKQVSDAICHIRKLIRSRLN